VATVYVVAPVFNEEGNIPRLLSDWRKLSEQLSPDRFVGILVDDGSTDDTVARAEQSRAGLPVTILRLSPNQGPGAAFGSAFEHVGPLLESDDILVTTEGDNTSRIDVLCTMLARLKREQLDVVLASPHAYGGGFSDTNQVRILLSHGGSAFVRALLGLHGINTTSSFLRAHRASAILALQRRYGPRIIERTGFESMVELLVKYVALGFSISEVAMRLDSSARVGKSKMKVAKTVLGYLSLLRDRNRWS
jgi:hypothetical protein